MDRIQKIVIVGGGTAGWMAATLLGKLMGKRLSIDLIESDAIGTVGVGEATIPPIQLYNQAVGVDENAFLKATQGTIKLGIQFQNWGCVGDSYMHAFGKLGKSLGMTPFHHYWLRAKRAGINSNLWDFSLNDKAAQAHKFDRLARIPDSPLEGLAYAFHFDAGLYAKFLRGGAERFGVNRIEGKITQINQEASTGRITDVVLESGQAVAGDLFIDCTGFRALLIGETLGVPYQDWSAYLPANRALAVPTENVGKDRPYTQAIAHKAGWQWRIPLQHRTGNGHVYCSDFISDDEATDILLKNVEGTPLKDPMPIRFTTGRRQTFWEKNVVSVGLSSGFLEPLESTSIHLIQQSIVRLVQMFPSARLDDSNVAEYNRQVGFEYDSVRDFIQLHYHLNQRDEPFWRHMAELKVPDSLTEKMQLFADTGKLFRFNNELFAEEAWLQVMIGQNLMPKDYHPSAEDISDAQLVDFLGNLTAIYDRTLDSLPSHNDFITRHAKAPQS